MSIGPAWASRRQCRDCSGNQHCYHAWRTPFVRSGATGTIQGAAGTIEGPLYRTASRSNDNAASCIHLPSYPPPAAHQQQKSNRNVSGLLKNRIKRAHAPNDQFDANRKKNKKQNRTFYARCSHQSKPGGYVAFASPPTGPYTLRGGALYSGPNMLGKNTINRLRWILCP